MRLAFVLLVLLICARAETVRRLVRDVQCVGPTYIELIPLSLAILDFCIHRIHKTSSLEDNSDLSMYELLEHSWSTNRFRYIVVTAILGLFGASILHQNDKLSSTYICTPATHDKIITIQRLALVLDFCISFCLDALIRSYPNTGKTSPARSLSITGWACLLSASAIGIWGVIWFLAVPEDRFWVLEIPRGFIWRVVKLAILSCIAALSFCITVSLDYPSRDHKYAKSCRSSTLVQCRLFLFSSLSHRVRSLSVGPGILYPHFRLTTTH
jgi:hypothetical protein